MTQLISKSKTKP